MVGIERKKENSNTEGLDIPANCPAVIVDMEREVPGKTAENIWQKPIQIACSGVTSSIASVLCLPPAGVGPKIASTIHIKIPPITNDHPMTLKLSRLSPIFLCNSHAGPAVTTNAIS